MNLPGGSSLADRDKLEMIAKGLLECETLDRSQIKEIAEHGRPTNPLPGRVPPPGKKTPAKNALASLGLTPRETEVLTWMAQGKTNYDIGVMLGGMHRDNLQACRAHFGQARRRKPHRRRCDRPCGIGQRKRMIDPVR
jgi:Bacterial regulatory proteins, luxR family